MGTILSRIVEDNPDMEFTSLDGFDGAVIGVTSNMDSLVYSIESIVEILMSEHNMSRSDAMEYFYFNMEAAKIGTSTPTYVYSYQDVASTND